MRILNFILFALLSLYSFSQVPPGFPVVRQADLKDARFNLTRHFTGESLFGYMDGGAELYREYGIREAVITELDIKGNFIKIEVFKMNGPEEAFGIFSVSRYRCLQSPPVAVIACQSSYQLQICKGSFYISVINRTAGDEDKAASLKIGEILARQINEDSYKPEEFIPDADPGEIRHRAVLAKGKLGLMNGAADWEDYFRDITGYCAMLLPEGERTILSVRFDTNDELLKFCQTKKIDPGKLTGSDLILSTRETVRLLKENHLIIRIAL